MSEVKLLPCPFCGGEASIEDMSDSEDTNYGAGCCDAGCIGHETLNAYYFTGEEAARDWNRRAPQPVCVTVPPIEWVGLDNKGGLRDKRSGRKVYFDTYTQKWSGQGLKQYSTREEACKSHQKDREKHVKRTLEGCNVQPFRDPKGLADALRNIEQHANNTRYSRCDDEFGELPDDDLDSDLAGMAETARVALEKWEEGK